MPSFTRLVALLLFAGGAFIAATQFQQLGPAPRVNQSANLWVALVGAWVGWAFVGPRIDRSVMRSIFTVFQGGLLTVFLSLALFGVHRIFQDGFRMRHASLGDAIQGFLAFIVEGLQSMLDLPFLTLLAVMWLPGSVLLVIVYRAAEARRLRT